jgi:hypothetical protein
MEFPDKRFIRYHSAANIHRVSHGFRQYFNKPNDSSALSKLPANDIHLVRDVSRDYFDIT